LETETDKARQTMGVCPQHDVLFEKLTCIEHLRIFAGVKGCADDSDSVFEELLRLVDLGEKRNGLASELSGGQKRKLSLAIALVGDPKFLILVRNFRFLQSLCTSHSLPAACCWLLLAARYYYCCCCSASTIGCTRLSQKPLLVG
jgi:ABC-type nitrate/sulfonate/bicarbonate transport system ATPase subunit